MKFKYISILILAILFTGCKKDFLEKLPLDSMSDDNFWTSEKNVRTFSYGFYSGYFSGYGSGFTWGKYFSGEAMNDDFGPSSPGQFTRTVPASGGGWTFTWVRKANVFIDRVQRAPIDDAAINHWMGIGRFFRGMEYHDLVKRFGDMPWYDKEIAETDMELLYKPRDPRGEVMDKVLEDFQFAAEHVRLTDGDKGLHVNRDVVLAFMSRVFLFEGTWMKYQMNDVARAEKYLEAAKWAAEELMNSGRYSLHSNYRELFSSLDLASNREMIMYRRYVEGILTHSLGSYNNLEPQTGMSKDAVDSYLMTDGLPVVQSPLYEGDKSIADLMTDRDFRLKATVKPTPYLLGVNSNYSSSGYAVQKFLNETIKDLPIGSGSLNPTDAPIIRYGEVLLNYAEAAAELGTLSQDDLNKTINLLRKRESQGAVAALEISGNQAMVNGTIIEDPERDPSVSGILWEIRRERRIELMMEGFRNDDLKRWKKFEYIDTRTNPTINRGAWVNKDDYLTNGVSAIETMTIDGGGRAGYIIPAPRAESQRIFDNPRVYLNPLPLDQITLYRDQGVELEQNPGWE